MDNPNAATNGANTGIAASAYALQQAYNTLNSNITTMTRQINLPSTLRFFGTDAFNEEIDVDNPPNIMIVTGWKWKNAPAMAGGAILINIPYNGENITSDDYGVQFYFTSSSSGSWFLFTRKIKKGTWELISLNN